MKKKEEEEGRKRRRRRRRRRWRRRRRRRRMRRRRKRKRRGGKGGGGEEEVGGGEEDMNIKRNHVHNYHHTRAVRKVSSNFEHLQNRSRGLYINWQPFRGDPTVHPLTVTLP